MSITPATSSTDKIVRASVFSHTHTMLTFDDVHGVSRVTLHNVPTSVAHATADAFNAAMDLEVEA